MQWLVLEVLIADPGTPIKKKNIRTMAARKKERYWEKKSEEFHWIVPLLNLHNKGLIGLCCTEEPDFHFHFGDRTVGVEFSMLTCNEENAEINEFKKLLREYALKFDELKLSSSLYQNKPYRIKVWFKAGFKPHTTDGKKAKEHKEELFDDLTKLLFLSSDYIETQGNVIRVEPELSNVLEKTEFQICYINAIQTIPLSSITNIIEAKEAKLTNYSALTRNNAIQEYWLAIGIGEQYDFYSIELLKDYKTKFSKIFAVQNLYVKQLL